MLIRDTQILLLGAILVLIPVISLNAVALIDIGVGTGTLISMNDMGNANAQTSSDIGISLPKPLSEGEVISVSKSDADEVNTSTSVSPEEVTTSEDLEAYARSEVRADESLEALSFSRGVVRVEYLKPGNLLKFIPVKVPVTVEAYADGGVTTEYPWYTFIIPKDNDSLESELRSKVSSVLEERSTVDENIDLDTAFSTREQAQIADEISDTLSISTQ